MTKDQTIAMAVKAGFTPQECLSWGAEIQRLSQLVAAQAAAEEREACAQTAMYVAHNGIETSAAIRERKSP